MVEFCEIKQATLISVSLVLIFLQSITSQYLFHCRAVCFTERIIGYNMSYHALQHINDGMSKKQYGAEAGVGMGIRVAEYHLNKNNNVNSASACLAKAATYGRDGPGEDGFADAGFLDASASNSKGKYGVRINKNILFFLYLGKLRAIGRLRMVKNINFS